MSCQQMTEFKEHISEELEFILENKEYLYELQRYFDSCGWRIKDDAFDEAMNYKIYEDVLEYFDGYEGSKWVDVKEVLRKIYGVML